MFPNQAYLSTLNPGDTPYCAWRGTLHALHVIHLIEKVKGWDFPDGPVIKNLPAMQETPVRFLGQEDLLEKGLATPSSIFAWRIPWIKEFGGLYSPWGCKELDTTEQLTHTYICIVLFLFFFTFVLF